MQGTRRNHNSVVKKEDQLQSGSNPTINGQMEKKISSLEKCDLLAERRPKLISIVHKGFPDEFRRRIWKCCLDVDATIQKNSKTYHELVVSINTDPISDDHLVDIDKHRLLPPIELYLEGPGVERIANVMKAFLRYQNVPYTGGMYLPLVVLLTQLEEEEAFWAYVKFYELLCDCVKMFSDELVYKNFIHEKLVEKYLPNISTFFAQMNLTNIGYTTSWYCPMFYRLPLEVRLRIFDVYFLEGSAFLYKAGCAILKLNSNAILQAGTFDELVVILMGLQVQVPPNQFIATALKMKISQNDIHQFTKQFCESSQYSSIMKRAQTQEDASINQPKSARN